VFVARGLDGAKVEEISRRAGLAKGSFYRHFESKDDAFRFLIDCRFANRPVGTCKRRSRCF